MISSKTTGLEGVFAKIEAISKTPRVRAQSITQGYRADDGRPLPAIANTQSKQGRNPWFLDDAEAERGMAFVRQIVAAWTTGSGEAAAAAVRALAEFMVATVRQHIKDGRSVDGPMKPLTERYAKIKEHVYRAKNKPILERSGELLRSIAPAVVWRGLR